MADAAGDSRAWQGIADILGDLRKRHVQKATDQLRAGLPDTEVVGACVTGCLSFNDRENLAVMYAAGVLADAKDGLAVVPS